jgi:hypothetical protein
MFVRFLVQIKFDPLISAIDTMEHRRILKVMKKRPDKALRVLKENPDTLKGNLTVYVYT